MSSYVSELGIAASRHSRLLSNSSKSERVGPPRTRVKTASNGALATAGRLPRAALPHFAGQLVMRAGSSNARAKEESASGLLSLAASAAVGAAAIGPFALRPLANSKSAHAAVGRLELLRTLVAEYGVGETSGLEIHELLAFSLPLCESASDKSRDAAMGLVLELHGIHADRARSSCVTLNEARRPYASMHGMTVQNCTALNPINRALCALSSSFGNVRRRISLRLGGAVLNLEVVQLSGLGSSYDEREADCEARH